MTTGDRHFADVFVMLSFGLSHNLETYEMNRVMVFKNLLFRHYIFFAQFLFCKMFITSKEKTDGFLLASDGFLCMIRFFCF
jgi:hypothetical protein